MSVPPSTPPPPESSRANRPAGTRRRPVIDSPTDPESTRLTESTPVRGGQGSRYAVPQGSVPPTPQSPGQPGQPYYPPQVPGQPLQPGQSPPPIPPGQPGYYYPGQVPVPPTAPPTAGRRRSRNRQESGLYLPWWSLLILLVVVGGIGLGALLVVSTLGGQAPVGGTTPVFVVITATYTIGPPASATPIPQPATDTPPPALPTLAPSASLPPGNFTIGQTVQVVGTGDAGLNVRSGPGTTNPRSFLAHDGDKFVLKEGPQDSSDGTEWWHITDPNNPNNDGWASRQFLTTTSP